MWSSLKYIYPRFSLKLQEVLYQATTHRVLQGPSQSFLALDDRYGLIVLFPLSHVIVKLYIVEGANEY